MRVLGLVSAVILVLASGAMAGAQGPAVGEEAPSFEVAGWVNLAKGEVEPTNAGLIGKVVMIEFWGTWCGPCVMAMPIVQKLHDRLRDRGLKVLAISYEPVDTIKTFADKNSYSFVLGSDPARRVVEAYGVKGWPTTVVIGKDGKIVYVGSPHDADGQIEKALGLESTPATLLTAAIDAVAAKEKPRIREAVARIAEKDSLELNLKEWAVSAGGVATEAVDKPKDFDALDAFSKLVQARVAKDASKAKAQLDLMATHGPEEFDATPWARRVLGKEFPIGRKEFGELLSSKRYQDAIDAMYLRSPPPAVMAAAAKDKDLREYCGKKAATAREEGKKAVMIEAFVLSNRHPKDNDGFWKELSVNGVRTSPDRKRVTGVMVGESSVTPGNSASFIDQRFARSFIMEALSAGKDPKTGAQLQAAIDKEREQVRRRIEKKYADAEK